MAASTLMYGVDSIVHVEDKDDIWFWQQLLAKYRGGRYKFKPATINEKGNRNTGCTQCLKYKGFLSQKFFICIDSDLRYLLEEGISAEDGILQTYTYSWEIIVHLLPNCNRRLINIRIKGRSLISVFSCRDTLKSFMRLFVDALSVEEWID